VDRRLRGAPAPAARLAGADHAHLTPMRSELRQIRFSSGPSTSDTPSERPTNDFGICLLAPHPSPLLPGVPGRGSHFSTLRKGGASYSIGR
jgi:hypothetical protein